MKLLCDVCNAIIHVEEESIPSYRFFVSDNYDGDGYVLCTRCADRIKHFLDSKEVLEE